MSEKPRTEDAREKERGAVLGLSERDRRRSVAEVFARIAWDGAPRVGRVTIRQVLGSL